MEIRSPSKCLTEDGAGAPLLLRFNLPHKVDGRDCSEQDDWAPANQMAVLFDKSGSVIKKRINHVLDEGELGRANNTQKCVLFVSTAALSCRRHGCGRGDGKRLIA